MGFPGLSDRFERDPMTDFLLRERHGMPVLIDPRMLIVPEEPFELDVRSQEERSEDAFVVVGVVAGPNAGMTLLVPRDQLESSLRLMGVPAHLLEGGNYASAAATGG